MGLDGIIALVALVVSFAALKASASSKKQPEQAAATAPAEDGGTVTQLVNDVKQLEQRLDEAKEALDDHSRLLAALVTDDEARHLWFLERGRPVTYEGHPALQQELRSLTRRGFVEKRTDFKFHQLDSSFQLLELLQLTNLGTRLLQHRKPLKAKDLEPAESLPPPAH